MIRKWQQCSPVNRLGRWLMPQATMNRRGDLKLSRVAWEMLECAPYALVLYDSTNRTIGLRPSSAHIKDTFVLKPSGQHGSQVLNVACLRYDFNVATEQTIRFHDVRLDTEGTLILELDKATEAYHGRRIGAFHNERKVKLERKRSVTPTTSTSENSPPGQEGGQVLWADGVVDGSA